MIYFEIFWVFFKISLLAFGGVFGVLPELERMVVVQHGWLTSSQFIQSYVVAQFVPGPNMAMCPLIGWWVAGWGGMFAGFLGIYLGPILVMTLAFALYHRYRDLEWVRRSELAMRPVVLGLMLASMARLWWLQSNGHQHVPVMWARVGSGFLAVATLWIYRRGIRGKKIDSVVLILMSGFVWWIFQRMAMIF